MEVYFYGSYAMSQKGFYFSRLEEGRLKEVTELPPVVNQFFSYDAFWLIWQDLDHENWLFPQATDTFFGVRNLRGIIDDREAYMNLAILGSIEEQASIARIAMHWFCHYHQVEQDFFACLSFDEGMCFQIDAPRFFRLFQAELEQTSAFLVERSPLSIRGLIHYAVCSYSWEDTCRYLKPRWLWKQPPRRVFSADEFKQKEAL